MKRYIREGVEALKGISFQMPGHKQRKFEDDFDFIKHDVTETWTTDNLLNPQGCIRESEREMERIFETKRSYYMVNGSSGSLICAIAAATKPGDRILVQRNCHKSVFNAAVIARLKLSYFHANYDKKENLITDADPKVIEKALEENGDISCVVITSPNYFGVTSRVKEIADIVHAHGAVLIVDEAHGPHLPFSAYREKSALFQDADLVIHSPHKTLPALTQTSLLHLVSNRIDEKRLMKTIILFTTTSPSYIFTQNMEGALDFMETRGGELLSANEGYIKEMEDKLKGKVIFYKPSNGVFKEPMKVLFRIPGLTGFEIVRSLYFDYNIRVEMADFYYVLAIATVMNTKEDYEILTRALAEISENARKEIDLPKFEEKNPEKEMEAYEAFHKKSLRLPYEKTEGRVAASIVAPYPPGVPILIPGELVDREIIETLGEYLKYGAHIVGIEDGMMEVIDE